MGGCFIHGYCLSVMMSVDLSTPSGKQAWFEHATEFILAAVRGGGLAPSPLP
jgi:hypothetical protein